MPRSDVWSDRRDHRGLSSFRGDAARPSRWPAPAFRNDAWAGRASATAFASVFRL